MIAYVLLRLLLPIIPGTATRLLKLFTFSNKYESLQELVSNNNKIILDNTGYVLPFKPLDKDTVKETLGRLQIKSTL